MIGFGAAVRNLHDSVAECFRHSPFRRDCNPRISFSGFWIFLAACFALPTEAAFSLVFYVVAAPWILLGRRIWPNWAAGALILWSGVTLLWSEGRGHRTWAFAVGTLCTAIFLMAVQAVGLAADSRRRLGTLLVWAGALNAAWSIGRGVVLGTIAPQLLGWGVTHHPILGASVMSVCLLTALARMLAEPGSRWSYGAAAGVMAVFILLTESRGPLLAACLGALVIGFGSVGWRWVAGAAVVMVGGFLAEPAGWRAHQLGVLLDRGMHHRLEIWQRTLELVGERPWFGHGLAANLDLPGLTFPHDLFLGVLFYSGIVGLCLFAALAWVVTARLVRMPKGADRLWLAALWVSALVSGLTDLGQITKGPGALWLIFWLPVGLVLAYPTRMRPEPCSESQATA